MTEVQVAGRIPLDAYAAVIGAGEIEELRSLARPLFQVAWSGHSSGSRSSSTSTLRT